MNLLKWFRGRRWRITLFSVKWGGGKRNERERR